MVNNRMILIRVTRNQAERIRNNAHAKGFKTVSAYIRSIALEHDLQFDQKFNRLYETILNSKDFPSGTSPLPASQMENLHLQESAAE